MVLRGCILILLLLGLASSVRIPAKYSDPTKKGLSWKIVDNEEGNFVEFPTSDKYPFGLRVNINKNAEILGRDARDSAVDPDHDIVRTLLVHELYGETFNFNVDRPLDLPGTETMKRSSQRIEKLDLTRLPSMEGSSSSWLLPRPSTDTIGNTMPETKWMDDTPRPNTPEPFRNGISSRRRFGTASSSKSIDSSQPFNSAEAEAIDNPTTQPKILPSVLASTPKIFYDPSKKGLSWKIVDNEEGNFVEFPISDKYPYGLRVNINKNAEILGRNPRDSTVDANKDVVRTLLVYEPYGETLSFDIDRPLDFPGAETMKRLSQRIENLDRSELPPVEDFSSSGFLSSSPYY
ncbi:hypothetical protein NEOLI_003510 [Neolecta irregularis DAH-3]|uniref:Uncharacterized protein n=1 Tax=Neolecta irregularis (strain DAH-3) TaxID=1198029 RepID=A0A1U7LUM9_NEOID|nr:hypothetical protein NEOLI_003510 [Neolecta irregularis DAH-3]|eukprot:OLL26283.1 hypothetical protein NEOLI_003510 [Neolecta irregularis DAH-3]